MKPELSCGVLAELGLEFPEFKVRLIVLATVLLEKCIMGPCVCTNKKLVPLASQSGHNTEAICHLLCPGCLGLTSTDHV